MTTKLVHDSFKCLLIGAICLAACSFSCPAQHQGVPYKQIRIPLDMKNGVPFTKGEEGYVIWGFDVDSNENFYFAGGMKAALACFSKDGKPVYRKSYLNHYPGPLHIVGASLYLFESWNSSFNTLVVIDKRNGSIVREYPNTITKSLKSRGFKSIQDYLFSDSTLTITYTDADGFDKPKKMGFNLKGELLDDLNQHSPDGSAVEQNKGYEYLGRLGKGYVLGKFDDQDDNKYDLSFRDSSNRIISSSFVELKYLGNPMCGFYCLPPEHRRLRNDKLYMLNRDKNMAVITEIDLANIFHVR